jgi:eukaryotic-like serine/threonine-protein kinase
VLLPVAASLTLFDFLCPPTKDGDLGTLGHYRVISELGRGGMGYVFRAVDTKLKRSVALKVMNKKVASSRNSRKRFVHEARAMAAVHHDNVVTIFEVGKSDGTPFMAMEMLKGQTLEQRNKSGKQLNFQQIIDYARQIATGLAVAHEKGIVHRDIKPANIWIEEGTDRIKILDFGLALASTPLDQLSGRGAVLGTPGYLSPEQARSEPLDDRSDLYSLGVVLYEACTGSLPVLAKSIPGQLVSIIAQRPQPIYKQNSSIPQPLCDLVHQLLRKEPRSRPNSATSFCEQLDQVELKCAAKSGIAIAINNLQKSLSDIARKNDNPESP